MTNPDNAGGLPLLQFAVFDEFGKGADDRVWDYGRRCFEAGELCRAAPAGSGEVEEMAQRLEERAKWFRDGNDDATLLRTAAALLRKLSTAGSGEVEGFIRDLEKADSLLAKSKKLSPEILLGRVFIKHRADLLRKLQQGADGWRPIESAPKDETRILLFNGAIWKGGWDLYAHRWSGAGAGHLVIAPSHWQPLPDAPASQGQEGGTNG